MLISISCKINFLFEEKMIFRNSKAILFFYSINIIILLNIYNLLLFLNKQTVLLISKVDSKLIFDWNNESVNCVQLKLNSKTFLNSFWLKIF